MKDLSKEIDNINGPDENHEKGNEARIVKLNHRMQQLRNAVPREILQKSAEARDDMSKEFGIKDGKTYISWKDASFARALRSPKMRQFIQDMSRKDGIPDDAWEVDGDRVIMYASIEQLEQRMKGMEDEWSTTEIPETKQEKEELATFNAQLLLPPTEGRSEKALMQAHELTDELKNIKNAAPRGIEQTRWGKIVFGSVIKKNTAGELFLSVPEKHAKEFRRVGKLFFEDLSARALKNRDGDYLVKLEEADMKKYFRQIRMKVAPDLLPFLLDDPDLKGDLDRLFTPRELEDLKTAKNQQSDALRGVVQVRGLSPKKR